MDIQELFDLAKKLDDDIAHYEKNANSWKQKCKLSDLKAYREHIQTGIDADVAAMESNTGE